MKNIPRNHNYHTTCPAAVKAKITVLEKAAMDYAFAGSAPVDDRDAILEFVQVARYELERTVLTCIAAATREKPVD